MTKRADILNDDVLEDIFSYLSISEKMIVKPTSRQFNKCVQNLFKNEKSIQISIKVLQNFNFELMFTEDLIFVGNCDMNSVQTNKEKMFVKMMKKFENIRTIRLLLRLKDINHSICRYVCNLFPKVEEIYVQLLDGYGFELENHFMAVKDIFGIKLKGFGFQENHYYDGFSFVEPLLQSGLLGLPSLQSIDYHVLSSDKVLIALQTVSTNIKKIVLKKITSSILNELTTGNAKSIQTLCISDGKKFGDDLSDDQILSDICNKLTQIQRLNFNNLSVNSLDVLSVAKNLSNLRIGSYETIHVTNDLISNQLKVLTINGFCFEVTLDVLNGINRSFPDLQRIRLNSFMIFCLCPNPIIGCIQCYKNFFINCRNLCEQTLEQQKRFDIQFSELDSINDHILLISVLDLYIDTSSSFILRFNSKYWSKTGFTLIPVLMSVGLKYSELVLNVIIDQSIPDTTYWQNLIQNLRFAPNLKLVFADNWFNLYQNCSDDSTTKHIFIVKEMKRTLIWISIYLGKADKSSKRMNASLNSYDIFSYL